MSAAFYLYSKQARRELNIFVNGQALSFCAEPIYLGIKIYKAFTFRRHFESLRKMSKSCIGLLKQLVESSCGVDATVLRTATLDLTPFYG